MVLNIFKLYHQACHEAENLENHNRSKALGVILKVIFKSVPELAARQKILENHNSLKALRVILNIFKQKIFENHNCSNTLRVILNTFLKPFLKGKILRSSERGVNSILTTILCF